MTTPETTPDTTAEKPVEATRVTTPEQSTLADGLYKAYEEYSRTLRTWLVAYGIGGPVLMLTSDRISKTLIDSGHARSIATLFLVGVVLQVVMTAINKAAMWVCYLAEEEEDYQETWWYSIAHWFSRSFWLDLTFDLGSLALFAIATWRAFGVLVS
jgi:uncharacterized membrane protein